MAVHWIDLVVVLCAAARVWHLGGTDKISDPIRAHVHGSVRNWFTCPRCSGLWWALAISPAWFALRYGASPEQLIGAEIVALGMNWAYWAARELVNDVLDVVAGRSADEAEQAQAAAEYAASPAGSSRLNGPVNGRE
jgi:hypothetical protein